MCAINYEYQVARVILMFDTLKGQGEKIPDRLAEKNLVAEDVIQKASKETAAVNKCLG